MNRLPEIVNLLFYTSKCCQNTFSQNTKFNRDTALSENSFQQTFRSYQKNEQLTQDTIDGSTDDRAKDRKKLIPQKTSDTGYESKDSKVEEENEEKQVVSDEDADLAGIFCDKSNDLLIEMLTSFIINKDSNNSSITEGALFENLKTIDFSIQKNVGYKPVLKLLHSQDMLDEYCLSNNIEMIIESLASEDAIDGIEKHHVPINTMENALSSNTSDIVLLDRNMPHITHDAASADLVSTNDVSLQLIESGSEEDMTMLETSGLALQTGTGDAEASGDMGVVDPLIKDIQQSDKSNILNYNLKEDQTEQNPSNPELLMDSILAEPAKTNSNANVLDITEILGKNSPAASVEIIRELAEKISMNLNASRYEMKLQLKPESLGRVVLKVTFEDGVLSGKIFTSNRETADFLQRNLDDLRNSLEQQGYKFSQLDVDVGNGREPGQFHQHWKNPITFNRNKQSTRLFNDIDGAIQEKVKASSNRISLSKIDYFA